MNSSPVIVFRLSSFGDLVLATSSLPSIRKKYSKNEIIFVTLKAYEELLLGHPGLDRVVAFDKKEGLWGWVKLCLRLAKMRPVQVFDLHQSTRTRLAKYLFRFESLLTGAEFPGWKSISKERIKHLFYYLFKRRTPKFMLPTQWVYRFSKIVDNEASVKTDLTYLLKSVDAVQIKDFPINEPYVCVMPSSRWTQKEWGVDNFIKLLKARSDNVFVLGTKKDESSLTLFNELKKYFATSASQRTVGFFEQPVSFSLAARILKNSKGFIGVDTGFFHLAESLGVKSIQVLGPTEKGLGYGPWLSTSRVAELDLFCRPCSKTGEYCLRFWDQRACLKKLSIEKVQKEISF